MLTCLFYPLSKPVSPIEKPAFVKAGLQNYQKLRISPLFLKKSLMNKLAEAKVLKQSL